MRKLTLAAIAFALWPALAPAAEKEDCTDAPESKWMSEEAVKEKVQAAGYKDIRSVEKLGSCYEVYAFDAKGERAEIYVDPVTAAIYQSDEE